MNNRSIQRIVALLNELPEQSSSWDDLEKEDNTFTRWALEEALNLIWEHPLTPALDSIENFLFELQMCTLAAVTQKQKRIFSIAEKIVLFLLNELKEEL